jgi:molecular chaperone DnaJ
MGAASDGGPAPDLYQLLGVRRGASREEIAQAWRRRARAEHPDSRPGDAAAPGRFRALAGAWHVLGDPARRAAYDQLLGPAPPPAAAPAAMRVRPPAPRRPATGPPGPPLWVGPVLVEGPPGAPPPGAPPPGALDDDELTLAILAGLAIRYLTRDQLW